jgi:hypothetical protein
MHNDPGQIPDHSAEPEMACGSKESERPLSRFPLRGESRGEVNPWGETQS